MHISLRQSSATGFNRWSTSHKPKGNEQGNGDAGNAVIALTPDFDAAGWRLVTPPLAAPEG